MDLLRLPWNGGNQRRRQFPIDQLFRRDDRAQPQPRGGVQPVEGDESFFQIPSKESKVSSPLQKVLDELNMSILPHDERLNAIVKAAEHFDHRDKARHDYELHEGAARIIYQKLALVLTLQLSSYNTGSSYFVVTSGMNLSTKSSYSTRGSPQYNHHSTSTDPISIQKIRSTRSQEASDVDYEIALLATCLELVHRASPPAVANAWFTIGEECLPILVKLLERPFNKTQSIIEKGEKNHQSASAIEKAIMATAMNKEMKVTVQKVTKLLAVYSLIPDAKLKMAKCPGLLSILVKITDTQNMNRMKGMRPVPKRLLASKNNQHGESSEDDRSMVSSSSQSTKMLGSVMDLSTASTSASNGVSGNNSGAGLYMTEASRFNAIAAFTNLASVEKNRMIMLSEPDLVNNIARVVHNERSDVARQCSALAIMYLTNGDREHVPELAGNDLLLESIIKLTKDDSPETRRNAIIALFNVACADDNTVKLVRYKDGIILDVLMNIIGNSDALENSEVNEEIRVTAAEALFNISCSSIVDTTDRVANHPNLLETCALVLKSYVSRDVKVYCAAILKRMAEIIHYPKNSQLELLSALVKASQVWTRTACIAEGFLSQASVVENRQVMAEHHGLLNSLSKLACVTGEGESDRVRRAAVSAIEHLSRETGRVRQLLSKHEGIMLAMTHASYGQRMMSSSGASVNSQYSSSQYSSRSVDDDASQASTNRNLQLAWKRLVEMI